MTTTPPIMILVRPQLGENIGKAARAMLNFGLADLRIVAPRDGWPNPDAVPSAAGADAVLERATVFESVAAAIADCTHVYATTTRERDMPKPVVSPIEAVAQMHNSMESGARFAVLFGPERSGLTNDDVALADAVLSVPLNPDFSSLNVAQAVIIVAYEFFTASDATPRYQPAHPEGQAPKKELHDLIEALEVALMARGYFRSKGRAHSQRRMLRNLFQNRGLSSQEIATLRGVIKSLMLGRPLE